MAHKSLILLILLSISGELVAATFRPIPYEKQLQHADAVFVGHYLGQSAVELEDGLVATAMQFEVVREAGLNAAELDMHEVTVYYPGGILPSKAQKVEGTPVFNTGEKVVLLLKAHQDGRLWGQSLALGTFRVVKVGESEILVNSVFPTDPNLSQIKWKTFNETVESIRGHGMRAVLGDKYVVEMQKKAEKSFAPVNSSNNRKPASLHAEAEVLSPLWLVFVFGMMGTFTMWMSRRKKRG